MCRVVVFSFSCFLAVGSSARVHARKGDARGQKGEHYGSSGMAGDVAFSAIGRCL